MKVLRTTVASASSALCPLDHQKTQYAINAMMYGDTAINATAQVDATVSDINANIPVTVSRSTTTVTVTFPSAQPHYLGATTDYIVIRGSGVSSIDGVWPIASISSATVVTFTSSASGTVAATPCKASPLKLAKAFIASAAASASTQALPAISAALLDPAHLPYSALILTCSSYTAGVVILDVLQAGGN